MLLRAFIATLVASVLLPAQEGRKPSHGINFYSLEKEIALGRQLALEVEKQATLVNDPILVEYLNRLTRNLIGHSNVVLPVTVKLIDSQQPNAFSLPGGHIFVNSGLVRLSETEAELAAALSHELAHVAARHATREATRAKLANYGSVPLIFLGGWGLPANGILPLGILKAKRLDEQEADLLGVQYLHDAGYDANAAVDFLERTEAMERKKPGSLKLLVSTHPSTGDRIAKAQKFIAGLPLRGEYVVNTSEYESMRQRTPEADATASKTAPTLLRPSERSRYE